MNLDRIISVQNSITVFRDGDRCLKVFNEDCAKADVINEALNQARMEETTVTVPKILEVTEVNGKWAIVSEYIKGENLEQLMERYPEKAGVYGTFRLSALPHPPAVLPHVQKAQG